MIDALLADRSSIERDLARRVVTYLRLMRDDARPLVRSRRVLAPEAVANELAELRRRRLARALDELREAYGGARVATDEQLRAAWRRASEAPLVPPRPLESTAAVVARIDAARERVRRGPHRSSGDPRPARRAACLVDERSAGTPHRSESAAARRARALLERIERIERDERGPTRRRLRWSIFARGGWHPIAELGRASSARRAGATVTDVVSVAAVRASEVGPVLADARIEIVTRAAHRPTSDELVRLEARAAELAIDWSAAAFASWHRERFGARARFDPRGRAWRASAAGFVASAHTASSLLVHGPTGSDALHVARFLAFERERRSALFASPVVVRHLGASTTRPSREARPVGERSFERGADGLAPDEILLVDAAAAGDRIDAALAERRGRCCLAIWIVEGDEVPAALRALPRVTVAPLRDRRDEVEALARGILADLGVTDPDALGVDAARSLWRQAWPGDVRELESWLRVALARPGRTGRTGRAEHVERVWHLGPEDLEAAARSLGTVVARRVDPRAARRSDVALAVESTRKRSGSIHRRRAAELLGWDVATLGVRLERFGIA